MDTWTVIDVVVGIIVCSLVIASLWAAIMLLWARIKHTYGPTDPLSASEALYGFVAWLMTREDVTQLGAHYDVAPVCQLVGDFCEKNSLVDPRHDWQINLARPAGVQNLKSEEVVEESDILEMPVSTAMAVLTAAFQSDPEYAYSWHANIAMAVYDSFPSTILGGTESLHKRSNTAASRFMKSAFDIETSHDMLAGPAR